MRSSEIVPEHLRDVVMVIDGFYRDPEAVRRVATEAEYTSFDGVGNFPGKESTRAYYSDKHVERFGRLHGGAIHVDPSRWVFGKFRLAVRGDRARTKVHTDFVDWTAVVYLSHDADCQGGLGVYRHRPTGLVRMPSAEQLATYGCETSVEFDSRYVMRDTLDPGAWELLHEIRIAFNRCVVFRGSEVFHGITEVFGAGTDDGRLTQNFFYMGSDRVRSGRTGGRPDGREL